jgi:hypothetical protein
MFGQPERGGRPGAGRRRSLGNGSQSLHRAFPSIDHGPLYRSRAAEPVPDDDPADVVQDANKWISQGRPLPAGLADTPSVKRSGRRAASWESSRSYSLVRGRAGSSANGEQSRRYRPKPLASFAEVNVVLELTPVDR